MQIIMPRMLRILSLILIFERNKIIFIIEFVYCKFEIIVISLICLMRAFSAFRAVSQKFLRVFHFDDGDDGDEIHTDSKKRLDNQTTAITTTTNEVSGGLCHRIFMRWVIWINFSQISDDFQWWWWW